MRITTRTGMLALAASAVFLWTAVAPRMETVQKNQVRHVVVFKFKAGAAPDQIQKVTDALRALKDTIPGIVSFEHGVNNSPENKNLGFTHAYLITFEDTAARDAYLPHPEHRKFGQFLRDLGVMEDVFVVDYAPAP